MLGNTIWKSVNEKNLSNRCDITKIFVPIVDMAVDKVSQLCDENYQCVCLQLLTNEVRAKDLNAKDLAEACTGKMIDLIDLILETWPKCKIIITLATPRTDNKSWAAIQSHINCNLEMLFAYHGSIEVLNHDDFTRGGDPLPELYAQDGVHLSPLGASTLAAKLKEAIHRNCDF